MDPLQIDRAIADLLCLPRGDTAKLAAAQPTQSSIGRVPAGDEHARLQVEP
jgi:hypothetical protein